MSLKSGINTVASLMTVLMGLSHFFVPYLYPWEQHLEGINPAIVWALYAMNFFFSFLLTWGGILTFISYSTGQLKQWIVGGMTAFWVVGGFYQLVVPFPIAEARWILPLVAFTIAILYFTALCLGLCEKKINTNIK